MLAIEIGVPNAAPSATTEKLLIPLPDRLRRAKNPVRKMIVGVRIEVSPPPRPPLARAAAETCTFASRLGDRISGIAMTSPIDPAATIAGPMPNFAAIANSAIGASALPAKPEKVWIEKARPTREGGTTAERIA